MNKRGVSGIISVALMVLLVIVAVSLIWILVSRSVEEGKTDIEKGVKLSGVRLKIVGESVWVNGTNVSFLVEREAGSEEISGFIIVLGDGNRTVSIEKYSNSTIAELGRFFVHIEPSEHTLSLISVIEVYGIVEVYEEIGISQSAQDVYQVSSQGGSGDGNHPSNSCSNDASCGADSFVAETEQCVGDDVHAEFLNYSCNSGSCSSQTNLLLKETCGDSCLAGACVDYLRIFYASPNGNGNGLTIDTPFEISDFWSISGGVQPGDALILLDGTYTGTNGMISPPSGLSGAAGNPIAIRALNEGKVWIDGEGINAPVALGSDTSPANWFVVEGINAFNSSYHVVGINGNNNVIRRVVGWDAKDTNAKIFLVSYGNNNLIEDSAGFGIARKTYESYKANYTTFRRTWGRWEGSHVIGLKMTYSLAYGNYNLTAENAIGTWDAIKMNETYVLMDYEGNPCSSNPLYSGRPECNMVWTNYDVEQASGIFSGDHLFGEKRANTKVLGSIAYLKGPEKVNSLDGGYYFWKLADFSIENSVSYLKNTQQPAINPFFLSYWGPWTAFRSFSYPHQNGFTTPSDSNNNGHFYVPLSSGTTGSTEPVWPINGETVSEGTITWQDAGTLDFFFQNVTTIGNVNSVVRRWNTTNHIEGNSINSVYTVPGESIFNSNGRGAEICYRYESGVLTEEPLWPWPMEQRIYDATQFARGNPVNVTQTMIDLFGPIPENCKWN